MNDLTRIAALLTAASISTVAAPSAAWARAAPVESKVVTGMEKLPEHAAQIRKATEDEVRKQLDGADVVKSADVAVHVDFMPGESIGWYTFDVIATHDGEVLSAEIVRGKCETCKPNELVAKIGEAVAAQRVALLDADAATGAGAADPGLSPAVADGATETPSGNGEPKARWTALGKTGIAVASVGAAAVITGIVLVTRPGSYEASGDDVQTEQRRNTRTPGIGVAAVGGVALVAGIAMVIADRVKAKRVRRGTSIAPAVGTRGFAVVIGGRF